MEVWAVVAGDGVVSPGRVFFASCVNNAKTLALATMSTRTTPN